MDELRVLMLSKCCQEEKIWTTVGFYLYIKDQNKWNNQTKTNYKNKLNNYKMSEPLTEETCQFYEG